MLVAVNITVKLRTLRGRCEWMQEVERAHFLSSKTTKGYRLNLVSGSARYQLSEELHFCPLDPP
jgi:hypothetical protein